MMLLAKAPAAARALCYKEVLLPAASYAMPAPANATRVRGAIKR